MKAIYKYDGPLGTYALEEQNGLLTRLWLGNRMALLPGETEISETPLLKEAHRQLTAYFAREQKQFDLPIAPEGTPSTQNLEIITGDSLWHHDHLW